MNSAARLVSPSSRYDPITLFLHELHWLKAAERIDYKLVLLVYKCRLGAALSYLADELPITYRRKNIHHNIEISGCKLLKPKSRT